jgi:predicted RNA-binding protein YlxR (DUF448 family)
MMARKMPLLPKRVPIRTCIACRASSSKRAFRRIVRTESGVFPDESGKRNGRGAYLCLQAECWRKALQKPQIIEQALHTTLTAEDLARLQAYADALPPDQKADLA